MYIKEDKKDKINCNNILYLKCNMYKNKVIMINFIQSTITLIYYKCKIMVFKTWFKFRKMGICIDSKVKSRLKLTP